MSLRFCYCCSLSPGSTHVLASDSLAAIGPSFKTLQDQNISALTPRTFTCWAWLSPFSFSLLSHPIPPGLQGQQALITVPQQTGNPGTGSR